MKKYSIILFLLLSLFSCKNEQKNDSYMIIPSGKKLSFKVPEDCKNTTGCLQYYSDPNGNAFLGYLNQDFNKILFYNIHALNLSFEIEMPQRGPNGVGKIRSFLVHNFDSIILTTGQMNILFLIDTTGIVKNKYKANNNILNGTYNVYFQHSSTPNRNLIVKNSNIYVGTHLVNLPGPNEIEQFKICFKINMNTNYQELLPLPYPRLGSKDNKAVYSTFGTQMEGNRFVYSFYSSHNIFITTDHKTFRKIPAKSKYIIGDFILPDLQTDFNTIVKTNLEHPAYRTFLYDKFRNVFYRFVYPGVKQTSSFKTLNGHELMDALWFRQTFSIMILDSNLNILGETLMPENTYDLFMAFVAKEGLFISANHVKKPGFTADSLKFELFKLRKIVK